jgi:hypothetical protein
METKQKQKQTKKRNSKPIDVGDSVVAIASGERKKKKHRRWRRFVFFNIHIFRQHENAVDRAERPNLCRLRAAA